MDSILATGQGYCYHLTSIGLRLQLSLDISQFRNLGSRGLSGNINNLYKKNIFHTTISRLHSLSM